MVSVDCPDGPKDGTLDCGHGAGNPFTKSLSSYMRTFGFGHERCNFNGCHYTHHAADLDIASFYHRLKALPFQDSIRYSRDRCVGDLHLEVRKYGLRTRSNGTLHPLPSPSQNPLSTPSQKPL